MKAIRLVTPVLLLLFLASPVGAQYLKITTDNPTDNTRLRASGTTLLTITLNTNHDRNNALQTCNSHTVANGCGSSSTGQALDMFGYTLALKAVGGTVTWGAFTPSDAAYTDSSPQISSSTEVEVNQFRPTGTFTSPGLATIGTIPVTPQTGAPGIQLQVGPGALNPFGFGTGFATTCDGFFFPNFYVVGDPLDPCGATSGSAGDWFDWDGAGASVPNRAPVLNPIADMNVTPGTTRDQAISGTDPDGNALTFSKVTGPTFMTVATGSPTSGNIHLAPSISDPFGTSSATVRASDGALSNDRSFTITIAGNRAPILNQPANMNVNVGGCAGTTADQAISGTDPDGDPLTFSKVAGPTFMTVTTTSPTTGNIHLAPGSGDSGFYPATVRASDGSLTNDKSFSISVGIVNQSPTLAQPANMTVTEGATADQTLNASAPCNAPLQFFKVSGPSFVTVTTTNPGTGTATGNLHLAPGSGDAGTYTVTVAASDGSLNNQKNLTVTVNPSTDRPPVLNPVANMGGCGPFDQVITGSDPDGDPLTFSKVAGPTFMSVTTLSPTTGNIHLAPGAAEPVGTSTATVRASDGTFSADRSFTITITASNCPPVLDPIANMFVAEGSTADQVLTAHDPNGNPLQFTKVSGPTFMTVTTTSPGTGTATGNIHLAPGFADAGAYNATVSASDGSLTASRSFSITVCNSCGRAPVINPVADMTVVEGGTVDQSVSASDPDGDAISFFRSSGPVFMTVTTTGPTTGTIHLAPGFADAGTYTGVLGATDGSTSSSRSFGITVLTSGNRCPVAFAGVHYAGEVGVPVTFTGAGSTDPDGNPLTYAWDFDRSDGITVDATGLTPSHTYAVSGTFIVTLTVTDNGDGDPAQICSDIDTATATIAAACDATVFNGYDTIRLGSGKPFWFAYVQPTSGCYANTDVVISSFVMTYAGRQISASGKTSVGGDKSGDGIQEIKISFSKDDLRALFSGTGLPNGHNDVTVTLEATLTSGGKLIGTTHLDVVNNGSFTIAEVAPNPLNPEATLTYTTSRQGYVRIDLFDVQGRLVRRLVDDPAMAAGIHTATIDGRGSRGEKLPSGVYYIRGTSSEGEFKRLITILK